MRLERGFELRGEGGVAVVVEDGHCGFDEGEAWGWLFFFFFLMLEEYDGSGGSENVEDGENGGDDKDDDDDGIISPSPT